MNSNELNLSTIVVEKYLQYASDRYENETANSARLYSNINLKLSLTIVITAALTALFTSIKFQSSIEYYTLYLLLIFQVLVYGYIVWQFAKLFWDYKQGYPVLSIDVGPHFCRLQEYYEENYSSHFTSLGRKEDIIYKDSLLFLISEYSEYGKVSFEHNRRRSATLTKIGRSLVLLFVTLMISFTMNYFVQNGKEFVMSAVEQENQPSEKPSNEQGTSQGVPDTPPPSEPPSPPPPKPVGPTGSIYSEGAEKPDNSKNSTSSDSSDEND
jgi:hypothetical protein